MTRISSLVMHQATLGDISKVMSEMTDLQRQISSEKSVTNFLDLSRLGKVERTIDFENKLSSNSSFINNNKIVLGRVKQTELSIGKILDAASEMRDLLTLRRSPSGSVMQFKQSAESTLARIKENLNTNYEGRFIFSGSRTDRVPVGEIIYETNLINDIPSDNYYNGDDVTLNHRAGSSLDIKYGIKANDEAFQYTIAAIHHALEGDSANDQGKLALAMEEINVALEKLNQIRAVANNNAGIIEKSTDSHISTNEYLNEMLSGDIKTNIPEATLRLSSNEAVLRATYMTFARISRLSLTEFL